MGDEIITTTGREPSVETDQAAGLGAVIVSTSPLTVDGASMVGGAQAGPASGSQGLPALQPDYPRSIKYIHTGAASTFPYTVTITGTTADGETDTEEIVVTVAATYRGVKAWAWITDIDLGDGIAGGDTWELQLDSKIGIPFSIYAAADVLHMVKNSTGMQAASFTINTTYNTIEETGVAVGANDEYWYYVRHHGAI